MNCNNSSTRRLALLSAGVSLFGAAAAFGAGPGGNITISSSPALSLGSSGLTQGLVGTIWHPGITDQSATANASTGAYTGYGIPGTGFGPSPSVQDITIVENYLKSGGSYSMVNATQGITTDYTLPAPSETFLNTSNTFTYNGGGSPTWQFLGSDASGAAALDASAWTASAVDQMGYIKIAAPGTYTFNMSSADDAGAVYIGGTGITPTGNAGTGTLVVANGYANTAASAVPATTGGYIPTTDSTANVAFSNAGYYPIEVMNYQQGGGAGFNFSVTAPTGTAAPAYYTTAAAASGVTSFATPTPATPPAPTDEWNFAKSAISGSTVSDIGTAGSASTAGTIVGTGHSLTGGALVTTSSNNGNGMSVPGSTFANYTGDFTISVTFNRSVSDPSNWGSLFSMGTQNNSSNDFILMQPHRQDNGYSADLVQTNGSGTELIANNKQPNTAGQLTQEVLVYNSTTNTLSLYINGVLQTFGQPVLAAGSSHLSLAALADVAPSVSSTGSAVPGSLDGIGGLDPYNDPTTLASYYDLSTWNSALTANQVSGLYAAVPVPEPGVVALLGLGAMGMLLISRRRKARC